VIEMMREEIMMIRKASPSEILAIENQGRAPVQVWAKEAIASSMHPQATQAAITTLRLGGSAVDAAVALGAALCVTNPDLCSIGGDSAWLIYSAETDECLYVDGYSKCAANMTAEVLENHFGLTPETTPQAYGEEPDGYRCEGIIVSNVPGTPATWVRAWERFGRLALRTILSTAIDLAERGLPINRFFAGRLEGEKSKLDTFASSRKIFLKPTGEALGEGETLVQGDLAGTLKRIAEDGHSGFYQGETAEMIVDYSRAHGGVHTLKDFANYEVVWRPARTSSYRGFDVVTASYPTSGIHMLQELKILENFDMKALGYHSPESLHVMIEAAKLSRADRRGFAGDPDYLKVPVEKMLDRHYAIERAKLIEFGMAKYAEPGIKPNRSMGTTVLGGKSYKGGTTHFVVRDKEGNIVSATQTVGGAFGCGEVAEGTGIVMNDRTWWMALSNSPNIVSPGRRANIGHSPTILLKDALPFMAVGSPGGDGIIQYVMQTIVNVIDYGFEIQEAIEAPRFRSMDLGFEVIMEKRIDRRVRDALRRWGHRITDCPGWTMEVGGVEGFMMDLNTGNILGGYDPRRNSLASGY
jgi:gamma-glutamyltranspeptidase/glutathione hydrolase